MSTPRRFRPFRVQRSNRSVTGWFALAVAFHALIIVALVVADLAGLDTARGRGGPGGGGGGGGSVIRYIELPPAPTAPMRARRKALESEPRRVELVVPQTQPEVPLPELPRFEVPRPPRAVVNVETLGPGSGTGDRAGSGSGSGGGSGTGEGTGVGSYTGPGFGDEGGPILAPEPRSVLYPFEDAPQSIKGRQLNIRFWVNARGRVTRVEVETPIEDKSFLKKLLERMHQWTFYPARRRDGTPVAGELVITYLP